MNTPHKWAKEIKAWADGAEIEFRTKLYDSWGRWVSDNNPDWDADSDWEYRIKPAECHEASKPKEQQYLYVYQSKEGATDISLDGACKYKYWKLIGKIKMEQEE